MQNTHNWLHLVGTQYNFTEFNIKVVKLGQDVVKDDKSRFKTFLSAL